MTKDNRQIRTPNNKGLLGYRAKFQNQDGIAIMKGQDCKECLGFITVQQLQLAVESGPYIDLEKCEMR